MTNKKNLLDRIDVSEPCSEDWEEMTGNDQVRFCSHCSKNVVDLSSYTRQRAEKLVRDSSGGLCVRYRKDERGRVVTAPPRFTQIKRRAKIAAGVLATTMSVASMAYTQGSPRLPQGKAAVENREKDRVALTGFVVSGVITDLNGAIVPGVKVILSNSQQTLRRVAQANSEGYYEFREVPHDTYRLEFEALPFKRHIVENLKVSRNVNHPMSLELGEDVVLMGVVGIGGEEIVLDDPPEVSKEVELPKLIELPPKSTFVLGLFPGVVEKPEEKKLARKLKKKLPK